MQCIFPPPKTISLASSIATTSFHASSGSTPFEIVYGRKAPTLTKYLRHEIKVEAVAEELSDRDEAIAQLKLNLNRAQDQMKRFADKHRTMLSFQVGEWVFLKLRPHRQQTVHKRINQKLAARYYGPYQILAKYGSVAYKLQLPPLARVHPVFHVSQLKKAVGNYSVNPDLPQDLGVALDNLVEPEEILASRNILRSDISVQQCLVKWKGGSSDDTTWEDTEVLQSQFPTFSLEDKAELPQVGNDRVQSSGIGPMHIQQEVKVKPRIWRVYSRRKRSGAEGNSVRNV